MAHYLTKHFGIEASVDAVNRNSAFAQLQWLLKDNPCFCAACREGYYKNYSVKILSGYEPTICTNEQQNIRLV